VANESDYYGVLEIARDSTQDDIKKAFRRLARKYHPDVNPGNKDAEDTFKKINDAYNVLGDAEARAKYDRPTGQSGSSCGVNNSSQTTSPDGTSSTSMRFDFSQYKSFEEFLSSQMMGDSGANVQPKATPVRPIVLSPFDAFNGTTVQYTIAGSDPKIRIPAGISPSGDSLQLSGATIPVEVDFGGTLYRMGKNGLEYTLPLTISEVITGNALKSVPTPWGAVTLTIPAVKDLGKLIRLQSKGWPIKTRSSMLTADERLVLGLKQDTKPFWLSLPQLREVSKMGDLYIYTELVADENPRANWERHLWKLAA
jgi:curved DNA-binding protein